MCITRSASLFIRVKLWMAATLDGIVEVYRAIVGPSQCCLGLLGDGAARGNTWPILQHTMWGPRLQGWPCCAIITGGGNWVEMTIPPSPVPTLVTAEKRSAFVEIGEAPHLFGSRRTGHDRGGPIIDMSAPCLGGIRWLCFCQTRGLSPQEAATVG